MVRLDVVTMVKPGKEIEFAQSMDILKSDEEAKPGGGRVTLCRDGERPDMYTLVLEWENDEDFDRYLDSEGIRFLRGTLITLCRSGRFSITPRSRKHDRIRADRFDIHLPRSGDRSRG